MLTLVYDEIIHENTKVSEFCPVPPDVLLGYISELADIFQYTSIYRVRFISTCKT